jgi:hypothetical protein
MRTLKQPLSTSARWQSWRSHDPRRQSHHARGVGSRRSSWSVINDDEPDETHTANSGDDYCCSAHRFGDLWQVSATLALRRSRLASAPRTPTSPPPSAPRGTCCSSCERRRPVKIATDLPAPRDVTTAEMTEATAEGRAVREAQLRVEAAAIRSDTGDGMVYSVPRPGRHHDVIRHMRAHGYEGGVQGGLQGFVLSDGRFVMRKAALQVARKAGQLLERAPTAGSWAHGLFSEDVW